MPEADPGGHAPSLLTRTIEQVHAGLFWARGKASAYTCSCGQQAEVWAYQYPEKGELVSPDGARYSENFEDYAPMCRRCHFHFDATKDEGLAESRKRAQVTGGRATREALASDPARMEALRGNLEKGWVSNAMCSCGYTSNAGAVGSHKKRTGHA